MTLVSLILVIDETFSGSHLIKDSIELSGLKCELLVYNINCSDQFEVDELKRISTRYIENNSPIELNYSEAVNILLPMASGDYICIFRSMGYFEENWLLHLKNNSAKIFKSGVLNVPDSSQELIDNYALNSDDDLVRISETKTGYSNVLFFDKKLLNIVGGLSPALNSFYAFKHFETRVQALGYINYSVPGINMINIREFNDVVPTPLSFYNNVLKHTLSTQNYFIPCFTKTASHERVIAQLSFLGESVFEDRLGAVTLSMNDISSDSLTKLIEIVHSEGLKLSINPVSFYAGNHLKNKLLILVK